MRRTRTTTALLAALLAAACPGPPEPATERLSDDAEGGGETGELSGDDWIRRPDRETPEERVPGFDLVLRGEDLHLRWADRRAILRGAASDGPVRWTRRAGPQPSFDLVLSDGRRVLWDHARLVVEDAPVELLPGTTVVQPSGAVEHVLELP